MQAYLIIKIFDVLEIQSKKYRFFFLPELRVRF